MSKSLKHALMALLVLGGASFASPAQAATDGGGVVVTPQTTDPGGGGGTSNYTYADITCTTDQVPVVFFKAWGNQYPGNTSLDVEREVYISGHAGYWIKHENWPITTGSGTWSVPTVEKPTLLRGTYTLRVWVYNDKTGKLLGSASDSCKWG
jgi:hypothetical protein